MSLITFKQSYRSEYASLCMFILIVNTLFFSMNRVIPVTIAIFRYILVCKAEQAERIGKARLARFLSCFNYLVPILMIILGKASHAKLIIV